jgi:hypothetical protein
VYRWYSLYHRDSIAHPWKHLMYQLLTPADAFQLGQRYSNRTDQPWYLFPPDASGKRAPAFILVEHGTRRWMGY